MNQFEFKEKCRKRIFFQNVPNRPSIQKKIKRSMEEDLAPFMSPKNQTVCMEACQQQPSSEDEHQTSQYRAGYSMSSL
jgi:hypothetical protein